MQMKQIVAHWVRGNGVSKNSVITLYCGIFNNRIAEGRWPGFLTYNNRISPFVLEGNTLRWEDYEDEREVGLWHHYSWPTTLAEPEMVQGRIFHITDDDGTDPEVSDYVIVSARDMADIPANPR